MADLQLNAIERKEIAKLAETCGYKSTHCVFAAHCGFLLSALFTITLRLCCLLPRPAVNRQETEKLLHEYRRLTSKTLDRSTFRDILHGTFGMTDDFFMDRGEFSSALTKPSKCSGCTWYYFLDGCQFSELLTKTTTAISAPRSGSRACL